MLIPGEHGRCSVVESFFGLQPIFQITALLTPASFPKLMSKRSDLFVGRFSGFRFCLDVHKGLFGAWAQSLMPHSR